MMKLSFSFSNMPCVCMLVLFECIKQTAMVQESYIHWNRHFWIPLPIIRHKVPTLEQVSNINGKSPFFYKTDFDRIFGKFKNQCALLWWDRALSLLFRICSVVYRLYIRAPKPDRNGEKNSYMTLIQNKNAWKRIC